MDKLYSKIYKDLESSRASVLKLIKSGDFEYPAMDGLDQIQFLLLDISSSIADLQFPPGDMDDDEAEDYFMMQLKTSIEHAYKVMKNF